ncbi:MBL fold metallo-hydrolase [Nanoarchaeota archaeon]
MGDFEEINRKVLMGMVNNYSEETVSDLERHLVKINYMEENYSVLFNLEMEDIFNTSKNNLNNTFNSLKAVSAKILDRGYNIQKLDEVELSKYKNVAKLIQNVGDEDYNVKIQQNIFLVEYAKKDLDKEEHPETYKKWMQGNLIELQTRANKDIENLLLEFHLILEEYIDDKENHFNSILNKVDEIEEEGQVIQSNLERTVEEIEHAEIVVDEVTKEYNAEEVFKIINEQIDQKYKKNILDVYRKPGYHDKFIIEYLSQVESKKRVGLVTNLNKELGNIGKEHSIELILKYDGSILFEDASDKSYQEMQGSFYNNTKNQQRNLNEDAYEFEVDLLFFSARRNNRIMYIMYTGHEKLAKKMDAYYFQQHAGFLNDLFSWMNIPGTELIKREGTVQETLTKLCRKKRQEHFDSLEEVIEPIPIEEKKVHVMPVIKSKATITALGGSQSVGRSAYLLNVNGLNILFDYGINFTEPHFPLDLEGELYRKVDYIVCSHAHMDHSGLIPLISKKSNVKTIISPPTLDLSILLWRDYVYNLTTPYLKPYGGNEIDVKKLWNEKTYKLLFDKDWFQLSNGVRMKLFNAGHILGSSMALIDDGIKKILYTGDFQTEDTLLLKGANFPEEVNYMITECTNGDRSVGSLDQTKIELCNEIKSTLEDGGTVLIPVYAVGRSPEILMMLKDNLEIQKYPIYVDGMIRKVNRVIHKYLHNDKNWYLNENLEQNIFSSFESFFTEIQYQNRNSIIENEEPKVIITTSGSMEKKTLSHFYFDKLKHSGKNKIIFTGYLFSKSPGRILVESKGEEYINYFGVGPTRISLQKKWIDLSGHIDKEGHIDLLNKLNGLECVVPVHGENGQYEKYCEYAHEIGERRGFRVQRLELNTETELYDI